jgi:hypothetical protein
LRADLDEARDMIRRKAWIISDRRYAATVRGVRVDESVFDDNFLLAAWFPEQGDSKIYALNSGP